MSLTPVRRMNSFAIGTDHININEETDIEGLYVHVSCGAVNVPETYDSALNSLKLSIWQPEFYSFFLARNS